MKFSFLFVTYKITTLNTFTTRNCPFYIQTLLFDTFLVFAYTENRGLKEYFNRAAPQQEFTHGKKWSMIHDHFHLQIKIKVHFSEPTSIYFPCLLAQVHFFSAQDLSPKPTQSLLFQSSGSPAWLDSTQEYETPRKKSSWAWSLESAKNPSGENDVVSQFCFSA